MIQTLQRNIASDPLRVGGRLDAHAIHAIRRKMMLDFCKWDGQIGDVGTLADFPLIITADQWRTLATLAESAAAELLAAERELLSRPDLHRALAIPWRIRRVLKLAHKLNPSPPAARAMRFDFHPTPDGWRISEVNSDVPGGFTEASHFTRLIGEEYGLPPTGDPLAAWADAIAYSASGKPVALAYAPGFLEDMQIMACLRNELAHRGITAHLAKPQQLRFADGLAHLTSAVHIGPLGAVVRFFQSEWLASLPRRNWAQLFLGGKTPVANPATSILTESKRFPLVAGELRADLSTWQSILPETRDPRDVPWAHDESWILKTAFCNTGDTVSMRDQLPARTWQKTARDVRRHPREWVAQRRFESLSFDSPAGRIYPCIGVYTINGIAAGVYGRFSTTPVVGFAAIDIAVLVEQDQ